MNNCIVGMLLTCHIMIGTKVNTMCRVILYTCINILVSCVNVCICQAISQYMKSGCCNRAYRRYHNVDVRDEAVVLRSVADTDVSCSCHR